MNEEALEPASLRLPAGLSATIRQRAKENRRSLNSEIIVLLEQRLADADRVPTKEGEAA